ncbi:hypothetical protein KP509_17G073600 [Ceratopteris richardii]|uniref:Gnk2-homologous domain-containing protein n=1 Tax=Ceratopteris richardii TaxID=49495 RepID=A0A8T2SW43_CERRI|nr:hypothetical protein KP509_17G073600 [Ceratopteris richardii]
MSVFLVSLSSLAEAQIDLQRILGAAYIGCLRNTTSLSITFSQNLRTALSNFTVLSSGGTRYAINIVGSPGQDRVYAVFQWRGDLSREFCQECVKNATTRLPQKNCPLSIEARMQLDGCFLRYGNSSFFDLDTNFVQGYCYAKTSDPLALTAISNLMQNVTSLAPKRGGFASAILNQEYALAQCLGYLNESECSTCLANTPYRTVCDSTLGEQVHLGSCFYRYEPYLFFQTEGSPSPTSSNQGSPSPTSSNHPRDSISPTPGGSSRAKHRPDKGRMSDLDGFFVPLAQSLTPSLTQTDTPTYPHTITETYLCTYIYTNIYISSHTVTFMHIFSHPYTFTHYTHLHISLVDMYTHKCINVHYYAFTPTLTHSRPHIYTHPHTCAHIGTRIHTCTSTLTHSHTPIHTYMYSHTYTCVHYTPSLTVT